MNVDGRVANLEGGVAGKTGSWFVSVPLRKRDVVGDGGLGMNMRRSIPVSPDPSVC